MGFNPMSANGVSGGSGYSWSSWNPNSNVWADFGQSLGIQTDFTNSNSTAFKQRQANREAFDASIWASNTAHQREMQDLKAAGLNPILAARGGASTPQASPTNITAATDVGRRANPIAAALGPVNAIMNTANSIATFGLNRKKLKTLGKSAGSD